MAWVARDSDGDIFIYQFKPEQIACSDGKGVTFAAVTGDRVFPVKVCRELFPSIRPGECQEIYLRQPTA